MPFLWRSVGERWWATSTWRSTTSSMPASACRRQGVGRALLAAGEAWARSQGAEAMRLVSGESRKGAHAFYASLGYTGNKLQRNFKKNLTQEGP